MSLKDYIIKSNFDPDGLKEIGQENFQANQLNQYANIAQQSYQSDRSNFGKFTYLPQESTDEIAVFNSENEVAIGIRGTTNFKDFLSDLDVTAGDYEYGSLANRVTNVQNKINKLKQNNIHGKKITISGHSLGGSIGGKIGETNPDLDVFTFNRGTGLNPFAGSRGLVGSIYDNYFSTPKKSNIKNYRISGDAASLTSRLNPFSSYGENFSNSPIIPTEEMKKTSDSIFKKVKTVADVLEPFGVAKGIYSDEYYLAHNMDNFINRNQKNIHPDPHIYSRKLATTAGKMVAAGTAFGFSKYKQMLATNIETAKEEEVVANEKRAQTERDIQTAEEEIENRKYDLEYVQNEGGAGEDDLYPLLTAIRKAKSKAKKKRVVDRTSSRMKSERAEESLDTAESKMKLPNVIDAGLDTLKQAGPYTKAIFGSNLVDFSSGLVYDYFNTNPENEFLI